MDEVQGNEGKQIILKSYEHQPHLLTKVLPIRNCAICSFDIQLGQHYIELFRTSMKQGIEFVHVTCSQKAIENWLKKKRNV